MSELDEIKAHRTPRSEEVCQRLARRVDRPRDFIVMGILWLFLANMIVTGAMVGGLMLFGALSFDKPPTEPLSHGAASAVMAAWALGFVAMGGVFVRWLRGRMRRARALVREGVLVEARVQGASGDWGLGTGVGVLTLAFEHDGACLARLARANDAPPMDVNAPVPILFLPGYPYCAVFPVDGRIEMASVRG